ncbi:MAG TPA: hypothetical protein DCL21_02635, partial [Alphaproteobacteria bacterium]|nr:hypothetical protein [Alphaproteobacteria bacterium]
MPTLEQLTELVKPHLDELEKFRLEQKSLIKSRCTTFIPLGIIAYIAIGFFLWKNGYMIINTENQGFIIFNVLSAIVAACIGCFCYLPLNAYSNSYKEKIIKKVVQMYGKFDFKPQEYINEREFRNFEIIPHHTYYSGEDLITGMIGPIKLSFSEGEMEKKVRKGDRDVKVPVFKGSIVMLEMPFKFQSHTVVMEDTNKANEFFKTLFNKLEKVRLEDPDFEKRYDVLTDNKQGAFYLLSPGLMKRVLEFDSKIKSLGNDSSLSDLAALNSMRSSGLFTGGFRKGLTLEFKDNKLLL